jgi:hypothetical protein
MFGYGVSSSIIVCIMKRFEVVKSIIIGFNTVFFTNNAQIISKSQAPPREQRKERSPEDHFLGSHFDPSTQ